MTLYIQVDQNNSPINHPCTEENLQQHFNSHDWSKGPMDGWLEFVRNPAIKGVYQKFDETVGTEEMCRSYGHKGLEYKLIDGKIQDFWHILDMTDAEKKALQDQVKASWDSLDPADRPKGWVFDETVCGYVAPVAIPSDVMSPSNPDGKLYTWDGTNEVWKELS